LTSANKKKKIWIKDSNLFTSILIHFEFLMDYNHHERLVDKEEYIQDYHSIHGLLMIEKKSLNHHYHCHHHRKLMHQYLLDFLVQYNHYQDQLL
jgi:hypothetical protein